MLLAAVYFDGYFLELQWLHFPFFTLRSNQRSWQEGQYSLCMLDIACAKFLRKVIWAGGSAEFVGGSDVGSAGFGGGGGAWSIGRTVSFSSAFISSMVLWLAPA
jgi:hypothetical protein